MSEAVIRERPARERLLKAAAELFYAQGVSATGIDAITEQAGVARRSLYNNFASKDDLVLAYIQGRHQAWLDLYELRADTAETVQDRVLAVFDAYIDHANVAHTHGFRGCGLLNAAAELPAGAPGREEVRRHKEQVESILTTELAGVVAPDRVTGIAEQLAFVLEGAVVRAGLEGTVERLVHARTIAASLVNAA